MRKVKKFEAGGLSKAQEDWLGGADRTDPFIMARMRKAVPDEVKTETAPAKAEPAKATPVKADSFESGFTENAGLGNSAPYKDARLVSEPPIRKPAAKAETKAEAKVETKTEAKPEAKPADKPAAKAEADDKPVPVKVPKETKTASKKYKSPGITDLTGTGTSDEERSDNISKLLKGVKSIFSGPADYITKGSPKMRAKEALKSGMESKDRDAMRKGGSVKMASGGKVKSASARADGCAIRGKTRA